MIDSVRASYLIYRFRCERRIRLEARRGAAVVAQAVAVPLVFVVALWWPWDVVGSLLDTIANAVKKAIVWVANTIAGIIVTVVNDVWSFVGDVASLGADALSFVADIGNSAFGLLKTVWDVWIPDAIRLAGGVAQSLYDLGAHYLGLLRDWVTTEIGRIWEWTQSIFGWIWNNIYVPLLGQIGGVFTWVWNTLVPDIFGWIANAAHAVQSAVDNVWAAVAGAVDLFIRYGSLMVRWFTEGVKFMLFVLEHPFDWWTRLANDAFARGGDAIENHVVALFDRRGGDILDNLAKWIG